MKPRYTIKKLLLKDSLIKNYKSFLINTYPNTYSLGVLILIFDSFITSKIKPMLKNKATNKNIIIDK